MVENESWKNIERNKELDESIEKEIKRIDMAKSDSAKLKPIIDNIEVLLHLKLTYEVTQRKIYLLRKAQERATQIFDRAMRTQIFILVIAAIAIAMAGILFTLMVMEASIALGVENVNEVLEESTSENESTKSEVESTNEDEGKRKVTATILAGVFGGFGIADIFILMKYIMNRSQRSLSDMVQTMISYIAFREQADALMEWRQLKDMKDRNPNVTLDELLKINKSLRTAASSAVRNIQKHVDKDNEEDSEQSQKPPTGSQGAANTTTGSQGTESK